MIKDVSGSSDVASIHLLGEGRVTPIAPFKKDGTEAKAAGAEWLLESKTSKFSSWIVSSRSEIAWRSQKEVKAGMPQSA